MPHPELYAWYSLEAAVSFFGAASEFQSLCNGEWLISPKAAICLTTVGEQPKKSHFERGSRFCWVTEHPYRDDAQGGSAAPEQVVGSEGKKRAIHLFVRTSQAPELLYLGALEPSYVQQLAGRRSPAMARFGLKPTLPSRIWQQLGGLHLGNLDFAPVDRALDRLHSPTTVADRLSVLEKVVQYWHGPIGLQDGLSDAELSGIRLPLPLQWWYRRAGRRTEIMSGQNFLFEPRVEQHPYRQLNIKDGRLNFYIENQGVYEWSTLPDGDDPPVFGRYEREDPWDESISRFESVRFVLPAHDRNSAGIRRGAIGEVTESEG
jgi:hypothetical protein